MRDALATIGIGARRSNRWILKDVTMQILQGAVTAVVGPNGSGKSSLLRCMTGLWPVTEGAVLLEGRNVTEMQRQDVSRILSYVPQEVRMEFEFSVREIVSMGRYIHRSRFARESVQDRHAVDEAMNRADVARLAERSVTQLSGGERQRVMIARSLAMQSRILLLDEPTSSLDIEHSLEVLELCRSIAREGRTVVIATHDLNSASRFADRVALIDSGRLVSAGPTDAVCTPENLERTFRVRSEIVFSIEGDPTFVFHRSAHRSDVDCNV